MEPVKARPLPPERETAGLAPAAEPEPPVELLVDPEAAADATVPDVAAAPLAWPPLAPGSGADARVTPQVGVV